MKLWSQGHASNITLFVSYKACHNCYLCKLCAIETSCLSKQKRVKTRLGIKFRFNSQGENITLITSDQSEN